MGKEKICGNLTENIGLEKFKKAERKSEKIKNFLEKTLTIVTASLSISGMVFAKNISQAIYDNVYGTGQGVATAINEGYIEKTENNYVTENTVVEDENTGNIIEDVETKVKIDEFIMDDFSLSITFDVEFSDKIKEIIKEKSTSPTYKSRIWPGPWINPEENASSIPVPSVFLYTLLYKLCLPPHKGGSVDGMSEESPRTSWHYGKVSR